MIVKPKGLGLWCPEGTTRGLRVSTDGIDPVDQSGCRIQCKELFLFSFFSNVEEKETPLIII